jgi:uncharacterized protein YycO
MGLLEVNGNQNYGRRLPPANPGGVVLEVRGTEVVAFHHVRVIVAHSHAVESFHHGVVIEPLVRSKCI